MKGFTSEAKEPSDHYNEATLALRRPNARWEIQVNTIKSSNIDTNNICIKMRTYTNTQIRVCVYMLVQDVRLDVHRLKHRRSILYMGIDVNISHDLN